MANRNSRRTRAKSAKLKAARTGRSRPAPVELLEITEQERPELPGAAASPYSVVYNVLSGATRETAKVANELRARHLREIEEQHGRYTGIATGVAGALHELRVLLDLHGERLRASGFADQADTLAALDRRIAKALNGAGVRLIDPLGERYADVAEHIAVKDRPADAADADLVVAETLRPGVLLDDGELLRPAQVFLDTRPEDPEVSEEPGADRERREERREEGDPQQEEPAEAAERRTGAGRPEQSGTEENVS